MRTARANPKVDYEHPEEEVRALLKGTGYFICDRELRVPRRRRWRARLLAVKLELSGSPQMSTLILWRNRYGRFELQYLEKPAHTPLEEDLDWLMRLGILIKRRELNFRSRKRKYFWEELVSSEDLAAAARYAPDAVRRIPN